jgi:hypothetical protein
MRVSKLPGKNNFLGIQDSILPLIFSNKREEFAAPNLVDRNHSIYQFYFHQLHGPANSI